MNCSTKYRTRQQRDVSASELAWVIVTFFPSWFATAVRAARSVSGHPAVPAAFTGLFLRVRMEHLLTLILSPPREMPKPAQTHITRHRTKLSTPINRAKQCFWPHQVLRKLRVTLGQIPRMYAEQAAPTFPAFCLFRFLLSI